MIFSYILIALIVMYIAKVYADTNYYIVADMDNTRRARAAMFCGFFWPVLLLFIIKDIFIFFKRASDCKMKLTDEYCIFTLQNILSVAHFSTQYLFLNARNQVFIDELVDHCLSGTEYERIGS